MTKIGLVLDCRDPGALAAFWGPALGYANVGAAGNYVMLVSSEPSAPKLLLQRVDEAKSAKNRMHLDIEVPDIEAEARRLESLGASRVAPEPMSEHGTSWVLMRDPEGNEFCVCDSGSPG